MQSYVYRESIPYQNSADLLNTIRDVVSRLRNENPELRHYQLADVGLRRGKTKVNVTLFFTRNVS
ncbi:MAG: hypothetical protein GX205_04180 [Firmicutes bacterium]|jgi:hypothetical protein|nr:hypothetical protein [Bacillota bacterium]